MSLAGIGVAGGTGQAGDGPPGRHNGRWSRPPSAWYTSPMIRTPEQQEEVARRYNEQYRNAREISVSSRKIIKKIEGQEAVYRWFRYLPFDFTASRVKRGSAIGLLVFGGLLAAILGIGVPKDR